MSKEKKAHKKKVKETMNTFPVDAIKIIINAWTTKKFSLEVITAIFTVGSWIAASFRDKVPPIGAATPSSDQAPELTLVLNDVQVPTSEEAIAHLSAMVASQEAGTLTALAPGLGKSLMAWLVSLAFKWIMSGTIS